jgi:hypothetical protein
MDIFEIYISTNNPYKVLLCQMQVELKMTKALGSAPGFLDNLNHSIEISKNDKE